MTAQLKAAINTPIELVEQRDLIVTSPKMQRKIYSKSVINSVGVGGGGEWKGGRARPLKILSREGGEGCFPQLVFSVCVVYVHYLLIHLYYSYCISLLLSMVFQCTVDMIYTYQLQFAKTLC